MTTELSTVSASELKKRARELVPLLSERATWIDEHGLLPDDVVDAFASAGLFRISVASQYGGLEGTARAWVDVTKILAEGSTSAAWLVGVYTLQNWVCGLFPTSVMNIVFSRENARVCGIGPKPGSAKRVAGGYLVSGVWPFTSGARHSDWKMSMASREDDGASLFVMMPMSDFEFADDWNTVGLAGTGSVTLSAREAFVPNEMIVETTDPLHMPAQSPENADKPSFRTPLLVNATVSLIGVYVGAAQGALDQFVRRLPGRAISHTDYASQLDAPITHLQVGESKMMIEEAEMRAFALADLVDQHAESGADWTQSERVWAHAQGGRVAELCKRAADLVVSAGGGSSIYRHVVMTRMNEDLQAAARHAAFNPSFALEVYGRDVCGLPPNSAFI